MDSALTPGNRPRKGIALLLSSLALLAIVAAAAAVVATPEQAEAAGLKAFTSCRALSAWGDEAQQQTFGPVAREQLASDGVGATVGSARSGAASSAPATTAAAGAAEVSSFAADEAALDATNVVVDGVDELDLVDRLGGDRVLVVAGEKLAIVDLGQAEVLATRPVPYGAQVTYDREAGRAWVVGQSTDGAAVQATRVDVGASSLDAAGTWTTQGSLVDARRVGSDLYLVASDGFMGTAGDQVPFGGGPVPCDEVLHPTATSDPTASLIVSLPVSGELQPVHATEVVGSGQLVAVTDDAAYLATPQWTDQGTTTTIHRFDLGDLAHTGSGSVPGTLLNDFAMSEHDGHLRVAITADGGGRASFGGRPMPVDVGVLEDSAGGSGSMAPVGTDGSPGVDFAEEPARSAEAVPTTAVDPVPATAVPDTTIPGATTTTTEPAPSSTTSTSTTSTSTTTTSTSTTSTSTSTTSTTTQPTGTTIAGPGPNDPLNKVVVLDTEGNLDVVGSTPWFGLPGETLHGIRFDGDTAYAVTFLQTDPFYVLDLANPTDPKIAGEVKLPGFSAYLHPIGKDRVVGFGPGERGQQVAKLFDVSDPAAPKVVDELVLGDDSPVVADHHAFVSLGDGRFAVPVTSWSQMTTECVVPADAGPATDYTCEPSNPNVESQVVEVQVDGSTLREVDRVSVELPEQASRVLPTEDGWAVLGGASMAFADHEGQTGPVLDI
jgi:uncharacterized secreted protein with C-terminal beta-propeller domain